MAEEAPKPPHKEFKDFMSSVRKSLIEQGKTAVENKEADQHFYKRQIRDISARAKSANAVLGKLSKHEDYLKSTSEKTQENITTGLLAIENMKMFGRDIKNVVKNTSDALSQDGFLKSIVKQNGDVLAKKFDNLKDTMKANRERMVHAIQTSPERMIGGIVNGVSAGVNKLRSFWKNIFKRRSSLS